jgi:hypothetical protein
MTRFVALLIMLSVALVGCGLGEAEDNTSVSSLRSRIEALEKTADSLSRVAERNYENTLQNDEELYNLNFAANYNPGFFLPIADRAIDDFKNGRTPQGSLSDHVLPALDEACNAGARVSEVIQRLDTIQAVVERSEKGDGYAYQVGERTWYDSEMERFRKAVKKSCR